MGEEICPDTDETALKKQQQQQQPFLSITHTIGSKNTPRNSVYWNFTIIFTIVICSG